MSGSVAAEERILRDELESKTNSEKRQMALDLGVEEADVDEALDPEKLFQIIYLATDDPVLFLRNRSKIRESAARFDKLASRGDSMVQEIDRTIGSGLGGGSRKRKRKRRSKKRSKKRVYKKRTSKKGRSKRRSKRRSKKR